MKQIIPFAHQLIEEVVQPNDIVLDATCGNGHDTLFLSKLIHHPGHVYAFDIQKVAITSTKELLHTNGVHHVTCIHDSHANLDTYLNQDLHHKLAAAMFNLGYLPRSNKEIITKPASTIKAINKLLTYIRYGGRIVLVVYHGHEGGSEEKNALLHYVKELDQSLYTVMQYGYINQRNNPPFIIAIEKRMKNSNK